MNAASERLERDFEIVLPVFENRSFAEIWLEGGGRLSDLDAVDRKRLFFLERRAISPWNRIYQLRMQGLVQDYSLKEQIWVMQNIGLRQAIRAAWEMYKRGYDASFQ